jgi:hypothetical protein
MTGSMSVSRIEARCTLLANGKVLVTGGFDSESTKLASAEIYDPATGTFTTTGSMAVARGSHTSTLLRDGRVLIAGDPPSTGEPFSEIYDPATGTFTRGPNMVEGRREITATTLLNGDILFAGGIHDATTLATAELYDVPSMRRRSVRSADLP